MKRALKNSVSILLLALAIAVTQIPVTEVAADTAASDFQMNGNILVKYTGTAKDVSVPASVKVIGEEAFADNTTLKKITFKGDIEKIEYRAFAGCTALRQIDVSDTVTEIGNGAFSNCTDLEAAYLGEQVRKIGIGVFAGCSSLKILLVDKKNASFLTEDGCLYDIDKTKLYVMLPTREKNTYSMPTTIKDIAEYAFWGCNRIKTVVLSGNLKTIPDYAFSNCKSLSSITIPYSVNEIAINAFSDCVNLEKAVIPVSVVRIHDTAFDGCVKLNIVADKESVAEKYFKEWKKTHNNQAEYEDTGTTEDGGEDDGKGDSEENGLSGNQSDGKLIGSTSIVGNRAVLFIDNTGQTVYGTTANTEQNSEKPPAVKESNTVLPEKIAPTVSEGDAEPSLMDMGDGKSTSLAKYTIVDDALIADQAFYRSKEVSAYAIQDGIKEIGEFAFARSNLEKAVIPEGVTTIGYGAFYHCDKLRDVKIPYTVSEIAPKAFAQTLWLKNWMQSGAEDYLVVGDGILLAYRGRGGDIVIPETVRRIAPEVFMDNVSISGVTFSDALESIGEDAFAGCRNLVSIQGGGIVEMKDRAFSGCPVETMHIPETVERMGLRSVDYSETSKGIAAKVVVFDGKEALPVIDYEDTAARLSNESARDLVLKDVAFAIVDRSITQPQLQGTILDGNLGGFKGIVAYISSREQMKVTCIAANMTKEELEAAYIPQYIIIDGKNYGIEGLESVPCTGNVKEEGGALQVANNSSIVKGNKVSAVLEGDTGRYYVRLDDSTDSRTMLEKAYESVYGTPLPENNPVIDVSLIDTLTGVSVTKLGSCTLSVTIPAFVEFGNEMRIFTADRNGQLESVVFSRNTDDNTITFKTNHLSPFVLTRQTVNASKLDISPDTGDGIHPKWFFAAGLLALSGVIFFSRSRKGSPKS